MREIFLEVGRELGRMGLVSSHSGNMSIRIRQGMLITRHGAMLACLKEEDIVEAPLVGHISDASTELIVHQAIYAHTEARAILHCHPPHAVLLSLYLKEISPIDAEGKHLLGKVPVVEVRNPIGSREVAQALPPFFGENKVVVIRGHGSFAIGQDLHEALMFSSALESSAKILYLALLLQGTLGRPIGGGKS